MVILKLEKIFILCYEKNDKYIKYHLAFDIFVHINASFLRND